MPSYIVKNEIFNHADYSDITIVLTDRVVKCHKLILCTNSDYFAKLCGVDAQFEVSVGMQKISFLVLNSGKERSKSEIELKEDDPDAMQTMLQYLYTGVYKAQFGLDHGWRQHLAARTVAEKYLITAMKLDVEKELKACVQTMALGVTGIAATSLKSIAEVIEAMRKVDDTFSQGIVSYLLDGLLNRLIREPEFRHLLEQDNALMLTCMDKMADPQENLVEFTLYRCKTCKSQIIQGKSVAPATGRQQHCANANCSKSNYTSGPIWLRPKDHEGMASVSKSPAAPLPHSGGLFGTTPAGNTTTVPAFSLFAPSTTPGSSPFGSSTTIPGFAYSTTPVPSFFAAATPLR